MPKKTKSGFWWKTLLFLLALGAMSEADKTKSKKKGGKDGTRTP